MRSIPSHSLQQVVVETLEDRRLMSANIALAFVGRAPTALPPVGVTRISLKITDTSTTSINAAQTVQLFASADPKLDPGDVPLITTAENLKVKAGHAQKITLAFPSPTTLPDGDYYLLAEVDGYPAVAVSNKPVAFVNPFSDVAVQFAKLPGQPVEIDGPSAGQRSVRVNIINTGNVADRGQMNLNFYLSSDAVLDSTDPLLAAVQTPVISLKPGQHKTVSFRVGVPAGTAVGGYFLFATLAPAASIGDSNPANNTAISSTRLAVVNQLPQQQRDHHHEDEGYGGGFYGYYTGPDDYEFDGGEDDDSIDTGSNFSNTPTVDDSGSSNSTPVDSGSSNSTDIGSSSSDDSDSGDYVSSGGDF